MSLMLLNHEETIISNNIWIHKTTNIAHILLYVTIRIVYCVLTGWYHQTWWLQILNFKYHLDHNLHTSICKFLLAMPQSNQAKLGPFILIATPNKTVLKEVPRWELLTSPNWSRRIEDSKREILVISIESWLLCKNNCCKKMENERKRIRNYREKNSSTKTWLKYEVE